MATTATGARASRRAAARQASETPVPTPEPQVLEADRMYGMPDTEADEAFGPEDVSTAAPASDRAANPRPASESRIGAIASVRPASSQHGAIALPMEDLTRQITARDVVMPKLRLSQAMSKSNNDYVTSKGKAGVVMGNWYISSSGQNLGETVHFVPVDMRKSRAMFVQGQGLMCRSFDLIQGQGDPGILCEGTYEERLTVPEAHRGCPLRLWNDKQPPKCGETYNFPGYVIENIDDPKNSKLIQVIVQFRSTAAKSGKDLITAVMNEAGGVWSNAIIEFGVETKSNVKGTFFVPTVDFYDSTDAPEFERIKRRAESMSRQMGATTLRASLEDDTE